MVNVGVRELKNNLSRFLEKAKAGETVVVTDRGKPVAKIEGFEQQQLPETYRRLVESGQIIDRGPSRIPPPRVPLEPGDKTVADIVSEQRG